MTEIEMNTVSLKISWPLFGMDSTYLCAFIAKIWLFLSFFALASKFQFSLIINNPLQSKNPNRIQRDFLFNNSIQSQNTISASSPPRQKTNVSQPCVFSAPLW
jgi:hypothetical protein